MDFLCANDQSEGDAYPPTIYEIRELLAVSTVFTTLDLNSGYWLMEINLKTQPLMEADKTCAAELRWRLLHGILG